MAQNVKAEHLGVTVTGEKHGHTGRAGLLYSLVRPQSVDTRRADQLPAPVFL